ncbi:MAG TPA: ComEC/Rec2 family competence protein, partial [Candidatus Limnocylindrales bacterium]
MPRAGWVSLGVVAAALGAQIAVASWQASGAALAGAGVVVVVSGSLAALTAGRRSGVSWLVAAAAAGILALRIATSPTASDPALPTGSGPWTATVRSVFSARDSGVPAVADLDLDDGTLQVAMTVPAYPVLGPGDRVRVEGDLRPPTRPGDSPRLFVRSIERVDAASPIESVRRAVGDALATALPEPAAGLGAGMVVGLRERVDRDLAADFTAAGVSHVVAISGWNVSLVIAFLAPLALRVRPRLRAFALVAAIAAFVVFAGASASVVRAGAMTGLALVV